ncbi:MAG: putative lactoylglutathione lyase [Cocleimonas sp.]|jgi:predicted lactoylglutathione lyase
MNASNTVISYITLGVTDLKYMQRFYTELGFELHSQSENEAHPYVMFKSGALILALYPKTLLAKQSGCSIEDSAINNAMSLSLNVNSKEKVDSYVFLAKQLKADITREGFEPDWGGYCAYFKDPENNLWEIAWNERFNFKD